MNNDIRFLNGYDLGNESLPFNWENTQADMSSDFWANELVVANQLMEEVDDENYDSSQEMIWKMLCN